MTGFWIFLGLVWLGLCLDRGFTNLHNVVARFFDHWERKK